MLSNNYDWSGVTSSLRKKQCFAVRGETEKTLREELQYGWTKYGPI
jgi:hypothetical protein